MEHSLAQDADAKRIRTQKASLSWAGQEATVYRVVVRRWDNVCPGSGN